MYLVGNPLGLPTKAVLRPTPICPCPASSRRSDRPLVSLCDPKGNSLGPGDGKRWVSMTQTDQPGYCQALPPLALLPSHLPVQNSTYTTTNRNYWYTINCCTPLPIAADTITNTIHYCTVSLDQRARTKMANIFRDSVTGQRPKWPDP